MVCNRGIFSVVQLKLCVLEIMGQEIRLCEPTSTDETCFHFGHPHVFSYVLCILKGEM